MTRPNNLAGGQARRRFFVTKTQPGDVVPDGERRYHHRVCGVTCRGGHSEAWIHGAGSEGPGNPLTKGAQASVVRDLHCNANSWSATSLDACLPDSAGVRMRGPPTHHTLANRGPPKQTTSAADRAHSWSACITADQTLGPPALRAPETRSAHRRGMYSRFARERASPRFVVV